MQLASQSSVTTHLKSSHEHRQVVNPHRSVRGSVRKCSFAAQRRQEARPARVVHATASTVDSGYVERERKTNESVFNIKAQAEQALVELVASLNAESDPAAGNGVVGALGDPAVEALRTKLRAAIATLQEGLIERDTEVRLLLLAAMAGEHILLIGPPGTAKSEVGRRLNALVRGSYFERLLTKFSVPEELFGPLSMRALEEDRYHRQIEGYLPTAEVAFIDEIFKANSAILNTLLTLINERLFDQGNMRVPVPLITMVGASNELPESEELEALYDRFLVRRQVHQVSPTGILDLLTLTAEAPGAAAAPGGAGPGSPGAGLPAGAIHGSMRLDREDILRCKAAAVARVRVPPGVVQLMADLRAHLQEEMEPRVYVSDRRLVKAVQLMQVAAYCNGRTCVTEYDVLLLEHVLWDRPDQLPRIHDWILKRLAADDGGKQFDYLLKALFCRACRLLGNSDKADELKVEIRAFMDTVSDQYRQVAGTLRGGFPALLDNLWLSPDESSALATEVEPRLTKAREALQKFLYDGKMLQTAVEAGADAVSLANLMPRYWADFIRNSDITEVRPLGTTPLSGMATTRP